jgi:hypothetical protein
MLENAANAPLIDKYQCSGIVFSTNMLPAATVDLGVFRLQKMGPSEKNTSLFLLG